MRLALLSVVLLALAVPAAFGAASPAGSLSIEDGRGSIVLKGKGIVIGRLQQGEVRIVDLSPLDQWSPRVNGVPRGRTVWLRGKDVNFYIPGGRYRITVRGDGFSVSARGQGSVTLLGNPDASGATGTFAVGDELLAPLPLTSQVVGFGAPLLSETVSAKALPS
ncbi:MAG: hypothetical protein M5U27_01580 [Gaiella sp.]|nr:hypothetical protein [Gaiella sp.]